MKCKKHPYEAGDGVCASCLRERLYALIAAQNKLSPPAGVPDPRPSPINRHLPFPRSASPCFSHRRSLGSEASAFNRFFSTPANGNLTRPKHSSLLPSIFGHSRSESSESRSPFSWLSALMRRKKSGKSLEAAGLHPPLERGMSLVRDREEDDGEVSGYSSDSSAVGRLPGPTPIRPPAVRRGRAPGGVRGISGFAVCLNPLVRSNPNPRRADAVNDQIRRRHVSFEDDRSAGVNRSRKLADFGRFK